MAEEISVVVPVHDLEMMETRLSKSRSFHIRIFPMGVPLEEEVCEAKVIRGDALQSAEVIAEGITEEEAWRNLENGLVMNLRVGSVLSRENCSPTQGHLGKKISMRRIRRLCGGGSRDITASISSVKFAVKIVPCDDDVS